jgi:hypothetical protein
MRKQASPNLLDSEKCSVSAVFVCAFLLPPVEEVSVLVEKVICSPLEEPTLTFPETVEPKSRVTDSPLGRRTSTLSYVTVLGVMVMI